MAIEGFWAVQFQGPQGVGGGVAVFAKGKVLGGDSGYTYMGTYEGDPNVKARIAVRNFVPGVPNVMGRVANFELEFTGTVAGGAMNATATLVGQPNPKLNARLTKIADLP